MRLQINPKKENGFTLMEIIVTLVIVSIIGSYTIMFATNAYNDSIDPIVRLNKMNLLESCMEDVNMAYMGLLNKTNLLTNLNTQITNILTAPSYSDIQYTTSFVRFVQSGTTTTYIAQTDTTGANTIRRVTLTSRSDSSLSLTAYFYALK